MVRIRTFVMVLTLVSAAVPAAANAADPTVEVLPGPALGAEEATPLTRAEQRSVAQRERQAARLAAESESASRTKHADALALAALCPSMAISALALEERTATDATSAGVAGSTAEERLTAVSGSGSCVSDFVAIYPRQQIKGIYCGPATVQQVINYTRGIFSWDQNWNWFTQKQISDWWLKADANGGTSPYAERVGMNAGSRLPSGFIYAERQVTSGADWHGKIITDVSGWDMPLTAAVAPHDIGFGYFLTSWENHPAVNTGHWIVMRGYYAKWDGTRVPLAYYTDSSGGYGGETGRFVDPSYDIYRTLIKTNGVHSQGKWIVW